MHVLALTGGIATGKSAAAAIFAEFCPVMTYFSADKVVHELLDRRDVAFALEREVGPGLLKGARLDRVVMRDRIFSDPVRRGAAERLLHPLVREECLAILSRSRQSSVPVFLAEIPLLFESGFDFGQEMSLLVAARRETQIARIRRRDGMEADLATRILAVQLPMENKIERADVVFWNEGPRECLASQIRKFVNALPI